MPLFDRPERFLASLFIPGIQWGQTTRAAEQIVDLLQPEIRAYPLPLEVPAEAPASVPRLVLLAPDRTWAFDVSLERVNLAALPQSEQQGVAHIAHIAQQEFWPLAARKLRRFIDTFQPEASRLGSVIELLGRTEGNEGAPISWLRRSFFSEHLDQEWLEGLEDGEFHAHQVRPWNSGPKEVRVNYWTRLKALHLARDNEPALRLTIDINTAVAGEIRFAAEEVDRFFQIPVEYVNGVVDRIRRTTRT